MDYETLLLWYEKNISKMIPTAMPTCDAWSAIQNVTTYTTGRRGQKSAVGIIFDINPVKSFSLSAHIQIYQIAPRPLNEPFVKSFEDANINDESLSKTKCLSADVTPISKKFILII